MKDEEICLREMAGRHGYRLVKDKARDKPGTSIADDLLVGGDAIARELGVPLRKFYRMADNGLFEGAIQKIGHRTYTASKRKLRIVLGLADEPASAA
jgi:hypothetical protein